MNRYPIVVPDTPDVRAANAAVARELTPESYARLLRAEGDAILAAHGRAIRSRVMDRVTEDA